MKSNSYFFGIEFKGLRARYFELAKKLHPDLGGTNEQMKDLNQQFEDAIHGYKDTDKIGLRQSRIVIERLMKYDGLTIEICGSWVWVSGATYKYKKELKSLGLKWHSKKKMWYHGSSAYHSHKAYDMEEIRNMYGSNVVKQQTSIA